MDPGLSLEAKTLRTESENQKKGLRCFSPVGRVSLCCALLILSILSMDIFGGNWPQKHLMWDKTEELDLFCLRFEMCLNQRWDLSFFVMGTIGESLSVGSVTLIFPVLIFDHAGWTYNTRMPRWTLKELLVSRITLWNRETNYQTQYAALFRFSIGVFFLFWLQTK